MDQSKIWKGNWTFVLAAAGAAVCCAGYARQLAAAEGALHPGRGERGLH